MPLNENFVSTLDLANFAAWGHNRGVQRIIAEGKIDHLFSMVGDRIRMVHEDSRRSVEEYVGPDYSINRFSVKSSGVPLGNHYHTKSVGAIQLEGSSAPGVSEIFKFDEGGGEILLQNISPDGKKVLSQVERYRLTAGALIVIPPHQAHTLFLTPGTKFRGFRTVPFDKNDMDLNRWDLELPVK